MVSRQRLWRANTCFEPSALQTGLEGCAGLSQLWQIQDVPGSWKPSVDQSFISARTVIDGEQNPPSNPRSEDEDKLSKDMVVPVTFFQRKIELSINCCAMHQEIIKGGDKTSLALWEGDCVSWFLWQLACTANKIFPPTWVTAGCILQTQHRVNKERIWRKHRSPLEPDAEGMEQTMKRCVTTLHFNH